MDHMRALVGAVAMVAMVACGVSESGTGEVDPALDDDSSELSTTKDTFMVARRDNRRCIAPLCGGYWVKDLNSTMVERYVSALDFGASDLTADEQQSAVGPDFETVLFGRLGPKERQFNTRTLLVKEVYRGLPGNALVASDKFYSVGLTKIACITVPCANLQFTRVNRATGHVMGTDLDITGALKPFVDEGWVSGRVMSGRALVMGSVVRAGGHITLTGRQVFLKLPDQVQGCPKVAAPVCAGGRTEAWNRDDNRCLVPAGCTFPGACPAFQPSCEPGYSLTSWVNVCPRFACDPDFLFSP